MKRLIALITTLVFALCGVVTAAPQNYDASGNPITALAGATFTTVITDNSAQPVCPGGSASQPGTCKIVSITVGCLISVTSNCTGQLAASNIGGLFDANSTSDPNIANGVEEIFPIGQLGAGATNTLLPWGSAGYQCQLGCVFEAGAALTNGVAIFISGSNTPTLPSAGGNNPNPTPTASAQPTPSVQPTGGNSGATGSLTLNVTGTQQYTSGDNVSITLSQSGNVGGYNIVSGYNANDFLSPQINGNTLTFQAGNPDQLVTLTVASNDNGATATLTANIVAGAISFSPLPFAVVVGGAAVVATINQPDGGNNNTYTPSGYTSNNLVITQPSRTTLSISAPVGATVGNQHVVVTSSDGGQSTLLVTVQAAPPLTTQPTTLPILAGTSQTVYAYQTGTTTFSASSSNTVALTVGSATFGTAGLTVTAGSSAGTGNIVIGGADGTQVNIPFVVSTPAPGAVVLSPNTLTGVVGATTGNTSTISQSGSGLTYTPSGFNSAVATVSINNTTKVITVAFIGTGSTTGTIASSDGTNSAQLTINVNNGPISANPSGNLTLTLPTTQTLTLSQPQGSPDTYTPGTNCSANYTLSSSNPFTITPVAIGSCNTTFTANDGSQITEAITVQYGNVVVNGGTAVTATLGGADVTVPITQTGLTTGSYSSGGTSASIATTSTTAQSLVIHPVGVGDTTATVTNTASGRSGTLLIHIVAPVAITASPNPISIPNAGTVTVNVAQGGNQSLSSSSTNTAVFTVPQYTNNGTLVLTGTSVGGTATLHLSGQNGQTLDVPVTVAGSGVAGGATPYPIVAANSTQGAQERTLLALNPSTLLAGREGSGTAVTDSTGNVTGATYGSGITWGTANATVPTAANHAPIYPGPSATDSPANYLTGPIDTTHLEPALAMWMHVRVTPSSEVNGTQALTYKYGNGAGPYYIQFVSTGWPQCVWRGTNSAGTSESIALTAPSADTPVVGSSYDFMCSTDGTNAWMTENGQLVASVTESSATSILTSLNYSVGNATRGLAVGSQIGAGNTYTAPLSANFVGQISDVAIGSGYVAEPLSTTDNNSVACSLENAALGNPAGTACTAAGSGGGTTSTPPPVTLNTSTSCNGTTVTSIALTYPTAAVYGVCQSGYTTGFSIGTPAPAAGVTAAITNNNQLTVTPTTNASGTTSITINGNASVSLMLQIGKTVAVAPRKLPYELAWYFKTLGAHN